MTLSADQLAGFTETVWAYFDANRRDFQWRTDTSPYVVFLSEVMLQQTQTSRVAKLLPTFMARFPDFAALAAAPLGEVLTAWQGLGYNRRAKFLHEAAQVIADRYAGRLPADQASLEELPGIGANSAGSILAYAYNQPTVFIETNIRTVFIYHFFRDFQDAVSDKALRVLVEQTLPRDRPRLWYWALMDYGVHLKQTVGNLSRQSKTYAKQSRFEGSLRQVRGAILRKLSQNQGSLTRATLAAKLGLEAQDRYSAALESLVKEAMVVCEADQVYLPGSRT